MMLGDVLRKLTDDAAAAEVILDAGDLALLAAMRERAAAEGMDIRCDGAEPAYEFLRLA